MKHIFTLTFLFFITYTPLKAQIIDVVTGLDAAVAILEYEDILYVSEVYLGRILKIDLNATQPTATVYVDGLNRPVGLTRNGNDLYIAETDANKISKIDLTLPNPTPTDVVSVSGNPYATLVNGNDLYIAEIWPHKISKIDLTSPNPIPTDVVFDAGGPHSLVLNGNDLYFTERFAGKISKIDITSNFPTTKVVVATTGGPYQILSKNDELFFSSIFTNSISKINITEPNPIISNVLGVSGPVGLAFVENYLYFTQNTGKISKVDLSTLSIQSQLPINPIKIHPNPSSDFIQISNLENTEKYKIINVVGAEIRNGKILNLERIDIRNLSNGLYFLKFENGNTIKFIKE